MPLDAICLSAVREEVSARITDMKIDKIQQPERDMIILTLRGPGGSERLLISAGSGDGRMHLTEHRFENPTAPPMFCMLLRKHLIGARVCLITQPPGERLVRIVMNAPDSMGVMTEKHLVIELLGRSTNIILTDNEGIIIDCLRRVGGEITEKRSVLPGLLYRLPPGQSGKENPLDVSHELWRDLYDESGDKSADSWLLATFTALSPLICREISYRAYGETDCRLRLLSDGGESLEREFFKFMEEIKNRQYEPYVLTDEAGIPQDFSYTEIMQYENVYKAEQADTFSRLLDGYFTKKEQRARVKRRASEMTKAVKSARDRLVRKLAAQRQELEKTAQRDYYRECGDIIKANMHLIKRGTVLLKAEDFYSEEGIEREIPLDPLKSPQQNAAKYYKDYAKAKNAEIYLTEQIQLAEKEVVYLESVLDTIALAEGENDLSEIRQELKDTGYIKNRRQEKRIKRKTEPMRFISSAGLEIRAGKNNTQNDELTLRTAHRGDIWLHTKNIHGSHVIIRCEGADADETTLYEAAVIAVYYSSSRDGGKTPVDYCRVKNVKKPAGSRPGAVIYTEYKTIYAEPDEKLVERLRK